MADRSISIRLSANVQGLVAGFKTAQKAAADFGSQTQKFAENNRQSLEDVGQAGMVMGGGLVAGVGLAVSKFASFDKAMSSVRAATHETEGNMDLLRDAAIRAGADTAFSAEEAARGIEEMAKAGVSTEDILSGGLNGALALAAAGSLDVGDAAELAATAMTQFSLSGGDIPHIADLLAAGAGKAQGSVKDMGDALKQAGLVADVTGLSIEETTGGLAAFASAGLVGSDAGTSFKSMLQRLTPQSKEASELMDQLGISAYDAQGNFIGLSEFAGNLQTSMADLTVEQRNSALATLFGSDAVRAAAILYENGAAGVQKWEDAVNDAGYAAETAALMQDNLAGDLEKLGGAFDTAFIQAGGGASEALRTLVQNVEGFIDKIGQMDPKVLSAVTTVAGLTGGALLLGGAFISVIPRIAATAAAMKTLSASAPVLAGKLGVLAKGLGIAAGAFIAFSAIKSLHNNMQTATASVEEMTQALIRLDQDGGSLDEMFAGIEFGQGDRLAGEISGIGDAAERLSSSGLGDTMARFGSDVAGVDNGMSKLRETFAAADDAMANLATSGSLDIAAKGFRDTAEGMGSMEEAAEMLPTYINSLRTMANDAGVAVSEQELLNWAMGEVPAAMEAAQAAAEGAATGISAVGDASAVAAPLSEAVTTALEEIGVAADGTIVSIDLYLEALFRSGLATMSARDATAAHQAAIDGTKSSIDAAKKAIEDQLVAEGVAVEVAAALAEEQYNLGDALNDTATDFDLTTESGRILNTQFQTVASTGMAEVEAKAKAGVGQPELQANLRGTYDSLMVALAGMGITGDGADTLARQVMGIPKEANIDSWMSDAAKAMAEQTKGALDAVDGRRISTYADHYETTHKMVVVTEKNERVGVGQVGLRAAGGAIYGPGSGTSDTAGLYALSNGEHVLTAREVAAMGGQAAVYDFRSQLKAGVKGFAGGGAVMRSKPAGGNSYMSTSTVAENHYHTHVDAAPGTAYLYAREVGREAAMKTKDTFVSLGL